MSTADRGEEIVRRKARKTKAKAESGTGWYAGVARAGLLAKGLSYGLVGVLAAGVAVGHGGKTTSRSGALATIADTTWGKLVLGLLALGFASYAIWRFVGAFAQREDGAKATAEAKKWGKRVGYVGRGLIYVGLAYSTIRLLVGSGQPQSQNAKAQQTTSTVFDWPAGRWLVAAVGLCIIGAGVWNFYRGLSEKFTDDWRGGMSRGERKWGRRAGLVGHVARGAVFGLIGIFLVKAALEFDPKDAIGLDGALKKLAAAPYGPWLLGLTAVGFVAYAVFSLIDARYCDVSTGR